MKNQLLKTKNKCIWKFKLDELRGIQIPKDSEILSVQLQNDTFYIWALVDPEQDLELRNFILIPTGAKMDVEEAKYITTIQIRMEIFNHYNHVYHLFEI